MPSNPHLCRVSTSSYNLLAIVYDKIRRADIQIVLDKWADRFLILDDVPETLRTELREMGAEVETLSEFSDRKDVRVG